MCGMPCSLPADDAIPIGRYGSSNVGRAKTVYRPARPSLRPTHADDFWHPLQLLVTRHGIQPLRLLGLIRNFRRHSWLLLYLLGASPAVCSTFVAGRAHELERLSEDTLHLPYATSLRMGKLGYQSDAQSSLAVSYNDLQNYAASLHEASTWPYPPYEAIGIREGNDYRQLATSLLQIENEFYGTIRPKRVIRPAERPLHALRERGVEYVEARLMDLDPFCPIGITEGTIRLLDVFLLHCLLRDSPPDTPQELAAIVRNQQRVAARGREPGLRLTNGSHEVAFAEWGGQVLAECGPIATAVDAANETTAHREALAAAVAALHDPAMTPSARVLQTMERDYGNSYTRFVLAQSLAHRDTILQLPFPADVADRFARLAEESIVEQRRIEAADTSPFETYRQLYLAPVRLTE